VPEARTVLAFTQRAAAREIEKVLRSAIANAEVNHGLVGDNLVVSAAYVDEGPVMKRWRARARGRVARIKKPTCHITVKLAAVDGAALPAPRGTPPPPPPAPEAEPQEPIAEEQTEAAQEQAEAKPKRRTPKPKAEQAEEKRKRAPRKEKEEETET
jgi:large subunit ribosomal protein L22